MCWWEAEGLSTPGESKLKLVAKQPLASGLRVLQDRKTLAKDLEKAYEAMEKELKKKIDTPEYVSVTTDIWSANNKSFMGATIHWIDAALGILQDDDTCFYGTLLPTLEILIAKTLAINKKMTGELPDIIVKTIKIWFAATLDSKDALLAPVSLPKFKLRWADLLDRMDFPSGSPPLRAMEAEWEGTVPPPPPDR
ncbi:unnamed protein product [Lepeophtheirus salmonis]|uniref:(salmon louse) hypothetical protein n=1 Tax=Lepeophtheirus salmonis TaxID=72036 RepID=A0A7R8CUF8_LEPSM|nr:unnamed protein product [Lepeophtheirus salmonis]CAF2936287.1 unnamed protein product [Lepeophtheirus salmonis]